MKTATILAAALVAGIAHGQAVVLTGSGGYGANSPYNKLYDRSRQVVFDGKVTGKVKGAPMRGMQEGMSITVKTAKSGTVQVDVGPTWFVGSQIARINVGDNVRVIGSQVRMDGQNVVLARQIVNKKNKRVLALRDLRGVPYWAPVQPTVAEVPSNAIGGTILDTSTVNIDGTDMVGYTIQTPNGNVNIVTAPQWFLNRQDFAFSPGAYVQILGTRRLYSPGMYVTVADTVYSSGNTIVFRNNGIPVWNGWGGGL